MTSRMKHLSLRLWSRSVRHARSGLVAIILLLSSVAMACSSSSSADPRCTERIAHNHLKAASGSAAIMRDVATRLAHADKPEERRSLSQELSKQVQKVERLTGSACQ
jgi:hypothetical protein